MTSNFSNQNKYYQLYIYFVFLLFVALCGGAVGVLIAVFLKIVKLSIIFLWEVVPFVLSSPLYPLILCTTGGIIIGLWEKKTGALLLTFEEVILKYKKEKTISYKYLHITFLSALFPLIFGGSVGPEAGLSNVIAGAFCWVRDRYKTAMVSISRDISNKKRVSMRAMIKTPIHSYIGHTIHADGKTYNISKVQQWVVYITAAFGGIISIRLINSFLQFGKTNFIKLNNFSIGMNEMIAILPLVLLGILCGILFLLIGKITHNIFAPLNEKKVVRAVLGGMILGSVSLFIPMVLFSGEESIFTLTRDWQSYTPGMLLITCALKIIIINVCLHSGWRGGNFFPILFCAASLGYGLSGIFPLNAEFVVLTLMSAFVSAVVGQPLIVIAICMVFSPLQAIIPISIAAFIGGKLPFLKTLRHS